MLKVPGAWRPNPALLFYPGLTSKPWHERKDFSPWLDKLEAATPDIFQEYERVMSSGRPSDYRVDDSEHTQGLHSAPDEWHWASLIDRGRVSEEMWQRCPTTAGSCRCI